MTQQTTVPLWKRDPAKHRASLLALSPAEKARRFDLMVEGSFSHVDGRDLLAELHPRKTLDIKRRVDASETWFEGDWLTRVFYGRDGKR